jgi:hypothetical protein
MDPDNILSCSRETATGPYPEPHESNPHPHNMFWKIQFSIIPSPHLRLGLGSGPFPSYFSTKILYVFLISSHRAGSDMSSEPVWRGETQISDGLYIPTEVYLFAWTVNLAFYEDSSATVPGASLYGHCTVRHALVATWGWTHRVPGARRLLASANGRPGVACLCSETGVLCRQVTGLTVCGSFQLLLHKNTSRNRLICRLF